LAGALWAGNHGDARYRDGGKVGPAGNRFGMRVRARQGVLSKISGWADGGSNRWWLIGRNGDFTAGGLGEASLPLVDEFAETPGDGGGDHGGDDHVIALVIGVQHLGIAVQQADEVGAALRDPVADPPDAVA
jgi:hypothetical protein